VARLLASNAADGAIVALSPREREVLGLMAEGRSNLAIAQQLVITERAVAKHTASIFLRLGLQPSDDDNRRVLAVIAYLDRSRNLNPPPGSPNRPLPGPAAPDTRAVVRLTYYSRRNIVARNKGRPLSNRE
jgi:DNA-binding CsgD family transcriptional regulator